jgi:hypothetical protein
MILGKEFLSENPEQGGKAAEAVLNLLQNMEHERRGIFSGPLQIPIITALFHLPLPSIF